MLSQELLAIKLALEEWRHWLEGASAPFTVITDHKNLQYLRDARRLNPRQARWALFFTRFLFSITYHPGSQNPKADALSRIHALDQPSEPEPILPLALIVSPIQWELTKNIHDATRTEPSPQGGPEGRTYVPSSQCLTLLGSVHEVLDSGHPGSHRRHLAPSSLVLVAQYSQGCHQVCPKLLSLCHVENPQPSSGWQAGSSACSSTTLVAHRGRLHHGTPKLRRPHVRAGAVDRFSKACRFIPLKGLPTALETAESLFQIPSCLTPETLLPFHQRTHPTGRTSSPRGLRRGLCLQSMGHSKLTATGRLARVPSGLGGIRTRRNILGGPGRYPRPLTPGGIPP